MKMLRLLAGLALVLALGACAPVTRAVPTSQPAVHLQVALGFVPSVQSAPFYVAAATTPPRVWTSSSGTARSRTCSNWSATATSRLPRPAVIRSFRSASKASTITYILTFWTKNPIGPSASAGNNSPPLGHRRPAGQERRRFRAQQQHRFWTQGAAPVREADRRRRQAGGHRHHRGRGADSEAHRRGDDVSTERGRADEEPRISVETIAVGDYLNLVPPGFVTGDKLIKEHPELVQKFVNATLRASGHSGGSQRGIRIQSARACPELSVDSQPLQRDVLTATLDYYKPVQGRALGGTDPRRVGEDAGHSCSRSASSTTRSRPTQFFTNTFVENATQ